MFISGREPNAGLPGCNEVLTTQLRRWATSAVRPVAYVGEGGLCG